MIHVSCAVEGDYVPHSAAMLHSVLLNSGGEEVRVHYLHGPEFDSSSAPLLRDMIDGLGATISFLEIPDARVEGLPTRGFTGKATWYRIFLPELLPEVDQVLYLDSDLIAMDSLLPLWDTNLAGACVGAVTNVLQHNHRDHPARLGLAPEAYFNAGVLLMDLAVMRRERKTEALFAYATENADRIPWRDQDALNVVLGQRRLPLHPRWNCMTAVLDFPQSYDTFGRAAVEEARAQPGIRHFEGPGQNKPWHYLCDRDLRETYFRHRRETPWPDVQLEGRTRRNVAKRLSARLRA